MSVTYSTFDNLRLDNGKHLTDYLDPKVSAADMQGILDRARDRAFALINSHENLRNQTLIPATHIPALEQVEIDLVIYFVLSSSYTQETTNISEWPKMYQERAMEMLENLHYSSIAGEAEPQAGNVGNGTVEVIATNDDYTVSEIFTLDASSAQHFTVYGTVTGLLPSLTVGVQWPEQDWVYGPEDYGLSGNWTRLHYSEFPLVLLVTEGSTPFAQGDKFLIKTWSSSDHPSKKGLSEGRLIRA
jgi:hypothetical protein